MSEFEAYREHPSLVPGAVVWTRTADGSTQPVLPDGCMDLIWSDGRLIATGPDTRTHPASAPAGTRFVAVRFGPGIGPGVLGLPAHELRDLRVPLDQLWPEAEVRRLAEQVYDDLPATGSAAPALPLESAALERIERLDAVGGPAGVAGLAGSVVAEVRRGAAVPAIARSVGLSERQLRRRCLDLFGYGPKLLGRVLRMNDALAMAYAGDPLAEIAATTGYADQAHLARDVKELTGLAPSALVRRRAGSVLRETHRADLVA